MDALMGATIFEFKRDLRREGDAAESQLAKYLETREADSHRRYLGIATDGAAFIAYELRKGQLSRVDEYTPARSNPRGLLQWLDTALAAREDLEPDPNTIRAELGRESIVFLRSIHELSELWESTKYIPEASLKRDLWHRHLEFVYGTLVEPDELFLQHTYLTIVAKTMAVRALVASSVPGDEILGGTPFVRAGLNGAVEADFFDWVLLSDSGRDLVERISSQIARFRLSEIDSDVLKALYESLIDPEQRHYLGEYYTPDWLAEKICREAIPDPLSTRVLDPACGSGTFIFHSVRRYLDAAAESGVPESEALKTCGEMIAGIDVHPVAVLFARVTYLLAIGPARLQRRQDDIYVPVYLGDSLQWDVRQLLSEEEVEITVPGEPPLRFPGLVAGDPHLLERVLGIMRDFSDESASTRAFSSWLNANTNLPLSDRKIMAESYTHMRALHEAGRNHIWTYIVRNLTRPLWLSLRKGKPDVVVGNPPWLRFNAMSKELQQRFRRESARRGLWVGGKVATHQDLSAYFFARIVERYLDQEGRIAFVMPLATLTRAQYKNFRSGIFSDNRGNVESAVQFEKVWTFDSEVAPLFPVPSAVLFGHRSSGPAPLPKTVCAFRGTLPHRDANLEAATIALKSTEKLWPTEASLEGGSPYRSRFRQGATIVPRRLLMVEPSDPGRFGGNPRAPLMESRTSANDKRPWKNLKPLRGQIEQRFIRLLLLGESIAPYRILAPAQAVIPWETRSKSILTSRSALHKGYPHLASWLKSAERLWNENRSSEMSFAEQVDYYGKLSSQFPVPPLRVVYTKAGTRAAAAIVDDDTIVIDHKLYWARVDSREEAYYLLAILNSDSTREKIAKLQSEGLFGPRDFDKVIFTLPIPIFSPAIPLHRSLADVGARAEKIALSVSLKNGQRFQIARRNIRDALDRAGLSDTTDRLVEQLIGQSAALVA
jgi:hypothetical protein